MPRRRHRRTIRNVSVVSLFVVSTIGYLMIAGDDTPRGDRGPAANGLTLAGLSDLPVHATDATPASPAATGQNPQTVERQLQALRLFELGKQNEASGDLVNARDRYGEALQAGLLDQPHAEAVARLLSLAESMIFGPRRVEGDPLTSVHIIKSGETLARIARQHRLPPAALARVNQLKDLNRINVGQSLKVLHGPFRAEVAKSQHAMFVYLGETLVRQFKVGLGESGSTPTGQWVVKNKLTNPTYFDPRGGPIVAADDPDNPLGERWIGLEGVSGEAVGQQGYGIHGTNEPETIGQNLSLGCVRMHNQDVEWLYDFLVEQHSIVTILD